MESYKQQFIEFMVRCGVLMFGDFTTKSGRKTPFFINTGNYKTGGQMSMLGGFYAEAIRARFGETFDALFGPAYKGIPLAVAASIALSKNYGLDVGYCFNRKEAKDHGEGGSLVGYKLKNGDRVLIIEDVTTAGTSVRETVPILKSAADVIIAGLVVSVDRMEKGTGRKSALVEINETMGIATASIVTLDEIVSHLYKRPVDGRVLLTDTVRIQIDEYRRIYGAHASA